MHMRKTKIFILTSSAYPALLFLGTPDTAALLLLRLFSKPECECGCDLP